MSTVSACFHFGTPNLRMSRHVNLVESVSTLKRQVERKKKERKKTKERTQSSQQLFFPWRCQDRNVPGRTKAERELMDLGGE